MHAVDQRLRHWQSKPQTWQQLLQQVFGRSAPVAFRGISVEILDGHTMAGLHGAYAPAEGHREEQIYLNGDWLESANSAAVEAVLLEELGHAIDRRLNGNHETAGDEGAIFSALIRNRQVNPSEINQNDLSELLVSGRQIQVEASSTTPPTVITSITDCGTDGNGNDFNELDAAERVTTVVISSSAYTLVASI